VANPKGEMLTIAIDEVIADSSHELGVDPGLVKDGLEAHLQELLAADPGRIEDGLVLIRREHATDIGPVIDAEAQEKLQSHITHMQRHAKSHFSLELAPGAAAGTFVAPTVLKM
jgi:hypothetical protein